MDAQLKNNNIDLIIDCPENINIVGLEGEFSQVILNLINNAKDVLVERGVANPMITITVTPVLGNGIDVNIRDNAGGVPESIFDKIYDPYFTTKEEGRGTGIGLYMSKMIIETNMGGTLTVFNDDEGANFVIHLKNKSITKTKSIT